ncbi:hypothetical protein C9426_03710 [Serratia sp. S1B]|nr:hypothetical protein C9426_03710 [Serratia sp. S1B]
MLFNKGVFQAGALLSLFLTTAAYADPSDYVRTPTVEYGEHEIDFKAGVQRNRDGSSESAYSIGYGFTPTPWWFTEMYAKYAKPAGESTNFDAWEWENRFQLTETGKYPVDVGFLLEVERPQDRAEGYELTYGPMFQTLWNQYQFNFNVLFQRHVHASEVFDTELHYQMQVKRLGNTEKLDWGVQAFGNVGQWDNWRSSSKQEFKIGPALFGKIKTGTKQAISWNTALLAGTNNATPNTTLRLQMEYEF